MLDTTPLSGVILQLFSPRLENLSFFFLMVTFCMQKILVLMKSNLSVFYFTVTGFSMKFLLYQVHEYILLCFIL